MTAKQNNDNLLDQATINKIKKELLARQAEITNELKELAGDTDNGQEKKRVKFPDFGNKTDENAQEIGEYSTNLATDKVLQSTLRDINNTIDRIGKGTYGQCKYCDQPIGKKRLLARPVASACIKCKTKLQSAV